MKVLLDGKLAPITFATGFLEMSFENAVNAFQEWQESLHDSVTFEHLDGSLEQNLSALEPLKLHRTKMLLLETRSPWVAYFDNGVRGPDLASPIWYMAQQKMKCKGVAVTDVPHTLNHPLTKDTHGTYGAVMFTYIDRDISERNIYVMNDGGPWTFCENGPQLPFEEPGQYASPRTRDRFNPEMLQQYCAALNIQLTDKDFYGPVGFLLEAHVSYANPSFSLAEARARVGLTS